MWVSQWVPLISFFSGTTGATGNTGTATTTKKKA